MHHLFIEPIVNSGLVRAFCWTLIHSCWQGLALAVLTGLTILLTRRSRPQVRYYLFSTLFLLFFLTVSVTFLRQLDAGRLTVVNMTEPGIVQAVHIGVKDGAATPVAGTAVQLNAVVDFFNRNAALIVAVWMFVFVAKAIRIAGNIITVNRIRNHRVNAPVADWGYRVQAMAKKLGIRRSVGLMESPLIAVPMTAGMLKPVILVPLGLLANLPPEQVEAILLHELAHIRRKDYFINLLQTCLETLFFFHPAIHWLSSLIRDERENCCDDIAIGESQSRSAFVHALVAFHEYMQPEIAGAMSFPGKGGNQLLNRVRRIVGRDDKRLGAQEKGFLAVCVLIAAGLTMAFTSMNEAPVKSTRLITAQELVKDTIPKAQTMSGNVKMKKDSAGDSNKEGQRRLLKEQQELLQEEERLHVQEQLLRKRREELYRRASEMQMTDPSKYKGRLTDNSRIEEIVVQGQHFETVSDQGDGDVHVLQMNNMRGDSIILREKKEQDLLLLKGKLKYEERSHIQEIVEPIVNMIIDKKIATDREHLKFELDSRRFVVNDITQPEEIFKMVKQRFMKNDQNEIKYARDGKNTSIAVNQRD